MFYLNGFIMGFHLWSQRLDFIYMRNNYNDSNMLTYTCIAEKNSLESSHHRISYTVSNARATYMYHGGEKD